MRTNTQLSKFSITQSNLQFIIKIPKDPVQLLEIKFLKKNLRLITHKRKSDIIEIKKGKKKN